MNRNVPGIEAYPDLVARYNARLTKLLASDSCGGCKIRELNAVFKELVSARQKRDKDFRRR